MKRSGFLKQLAAFIAAPSLLSAIPEETKEVVKEAAKVNIAPDGCDGVTIYGNRHPNLRVGDIVSSDMGKKGVVTSINVAGNSGIIVIRSLVKGRYQYKDKDSIFHYGSLAPLNENK